MASIYCPHCHKHTALSVAPTGTNRNNQPSGAVWKKDDYCEWWIGICNACDEPVLVLNDCFQVYPNPLPTPTDDRIPTTIREDLIEAKMCFAGGCFRAASVLARRCIEATCNDNGATTGRLVAKIEALHSNGTITSHVKDWATAVRWIGNDAAHPDAARVSEEEAQDALHLAEEFLHIIYVTPAIARARIAARSDDQSSPAEGT